MCFLAAPPPPGPWACGTLSGLWASGGRLRHGHLSRGTGVDGSVEASGETQNKRGAVIRRLLGLAGPLALSSGPRGPSPPPPPPPSFSEARPRPRRDPQPSLLNPHTPRSPLPAPALPRPRSRPRVAAGASQRPQRRAPRAWARGSRRAAGLKTDAGGPAAAAPARHAGSQ